MCVNLKEKKNCIQTLTAVFLDGRIWDLGFVCLFLVFLFYAKFLNLL